MKLYAKTVEPDLPAAALRLDPALGPGEARVLSEKEAMLVFEKKLEQFDRKA